MSQEEAIKLRAKLYRLGHAFDEILEVRGNYAIVSLHTLGLAGIDGRKPFSSGMSSGRFYNNHFRHGQEAIDAVREAIDLLIQEEQQDAMCGAVRRQVER